MRWVYILGYLRRDVEIIHGIYYINVNNNNKYGMCVRDWDSLGVMWNEKWKLHTTPKVNAYRCIHSSIYILTYTRQCKMVWFFKTRLCVGNSCPHPLPLYECSIWYACKWLYLDERMYTVLYSSSKITLQPMPPRLRLALRHCHKGTALQQNRNVYANMLYMDLEARGCAEKQIGLHKSAFNLWHLRRKVQMRKLAYLPLFLPQKWPAVILHTYILYVARWQWRILQLPEISIFTSMTDWHFLLTDTSQHTHSQLSHANTQEAQMYVGLHAISNNN